MSLEIFIILMLGSSVLLFVTARTDYRIARDLGLKQIPELIVCVACIALAGVIASGTMVRLKDVTEIDTDWVSYVFLGLTLIGLVVLMACSLYVRSEAAKRKSLNY